MKSFKKHEQKFITETTTESFKNISGQLFFEKILHHNYLVAVLSSYITPFRNELDKL